MVKKYILVLILGLLFVFSFSYFELEESFSDSSSMIGLTIDGLESTTFPDSKSGYAIDSILCDKGANGVWDYKNWTLKIRNVTQSRTKCQVNFASKYTESILNGTDPILKDELIPVMIDSDGVVKKASLGWEWYEYGDADNPRWANAVILNDETEIYYDGDIIPEDAIESYFVWIPRYQYKIFDMGNYEGLTTIQNKPQIIDIQFGLHTTRDSDTTCKTPMESGESGTCSVGKYMTHPAFLSFQSTGMWVGKFETGYKDASTKEEAEKNENSPSKVQIKPNVYSWRGIQVANAHLTSYNYKRSLDSHMMKNTEWGAVAYLSHSQYGSHDNIRINNNSEYKTGYAGVNEPTTGYTGTNISCSTNKDACNEYGTSSDITRPWNTEIGVLASTTGNISGVYDMSGGAWEYVMGVMLSSDNQTPCSGRDSNVHSNFQGLYCFRDGMFDGEPFPEIKYYDSYEYHSNTFFYNARILGDATGETGPFAIRQYELQTRQVSAWYLNEGNFVSSYYPWFERGGSAIHGGGTGAGVFSFGGGGGSIDLNHSFRLALSLG